MARLPWHIDARFPVEVVAQIVLLVRVQGRCLWQVGEAGKKSFLWQKDLEGKEYRLDGNWAARTLHIFLSLTVALWVGWSIPRLGPMSWPVDIKKEIASPTLKQQALVEEQCRWWKQHVHRNVLHHFSPIPLQDIG